MEKWVGFFDIAVAQSMGKDGNFNVIRTIMQIRFKRVAIGPNRPSVDSPVPVKPACLPTISG